MKPHPCLFVLLVSSAPWQLQAEPHPHRGKVTPFQLGDPGVTLNREALSILEAGQPYTTQLQSGTAGRGLVVQDVKAPTHLVWDRILDFDAYPKMVPKTVESKIYRTQKSKHQERIWVRMKIGFPVLKLQFYVNHLYDPSQNSMTWTLDYDAKSDLDDSCGYWYVVPHPDNPKHWSRVYYSVDVSMFPWVPQFVVDFMSKQALTDATAWVKKYSELEATKVGIDAPAETTTPVKKKKGFWGKPRPPRMPATEPEASSVVVTAATRQQEIGLTRYALVSSVLALSFYNVHLYFSQ